MDSKKTFLVTLIFSVKASKRMVNILDLDYLVLRAIYERLLSIGYSFLEVFL